VKRPPSLPSGLTLRPAVADDAAAVATVLIESRRVLMPFAPSVHDEADVRQWVKDQLLTSTNVTVAAVDGALVGVMATSQRDGCAWIEQLYVLPSQVARGFGAALLAEALERLPRPVQLYCFQANTRARGFYERRGFRALSFGDGAGNEERCPDALYRLDAPAAALSSPA
jgi:GNAT superfamily N-acetyltransferase